MRVSYRYDDPNICLCFLKPWILLQDHRTVIKTMQLTLKQCYCLIYRLYKICQLSFIAKTIQNLNSVIFSLQSTLIWNSFLSLSFSWHWYFWRVQASYCVDCPSTQVCWLFPHDQIQGMHFWQEYHRRGAESYSGRPIRRRILLIIPPSAARFFGYWVKVVSARFPHCKVTISPFVTKKYCGGLLLEIQNIIQPLCR